MVSQAEIEQLQADAEAHLLGTATVLVAGEITDGAGGYTHGFTDGPEVACTLAPIGRTGRAQEVGDQVDESSTHIVTLPVGTELRDIDRLRIDGTTYAVTAFRDFGPLQFTLRVEAKEVIDP